MLPLILIFIFLIIFLITSAAVGIASLLLGRFRVAETGAGPAGAYVETPLLLRQQLLSTIFVWHRFLARFDFVEILRLRIAEAGLSWSVGRVTSMMLLLGALGAAMLFAADWVPVITAPLAATAGTLIPYSYILRKRKQRFQKIEQQFPDALDSLSRSLRAGHPFGAGMDMVAGECPEPLAQEMRKACDEWQLGLAWNEALENFARRMPLLEVRLFVAAVVLQSRFGGKLNEILEELAKAIRDAIALRGDVQAISAQGRLTGMILTILPIGIAGVMFVASPAYISVLFSHPYGRYLIAGALVCLALGHLVIRRIVNVKV
jgi:tight adherence protein B